MKKENFIRGKEIAKLRKRALKIKNEKIKKKIKKLLGEINE
jgi:hypothetical protein